MRHWCRTVYLNGATDNHQRVHVDPVLACTGHRCCPWSTIITAAAANIPPTTGSGPKLSVTVCTCQVSVSEWEKQPAPPPSVEGKGWAVTGRIWPSRDQFPISVISRSAHVRVCVAHYTECQVALLRQATPMVKLVQAICPSPCLAAFRHAQPAHSRCQFILFGVVAYSLPICPGRQPHGLVLAHPSPCMFLSKRLSSADLAGRLDDSFSS